MSISTKKVYATRGFTLLEILLVVGIIAILAGIVILAINPTKQLGDTRNAQRRSDVLTILNAVYQFSIDHNGKLPTDDGEITGDVIIPVYEEGVMDESVACDFGSAGYEDSNKTSEISEDADTSSAGVDLYTSLVGSDSGYLTDIPKDPSLGDGDDSGYHIVQTASGRVTVCAPLSIGEGNIPSDGDIDDMIKVTR